MVRQSQRLPANDFRGRHFERLQLEHFTVKVARNNLATNRFGVVIPKTVVKLATDRHKLKRQILSQLLTLPKVGKDILIIGKASLQKIVRKNLVQELEKAKKLIIS